jgi:hypothetical protein
LDGVAFILPDTGLFRYMHVRKGALISCQIEGTPSAFVRRGRNINSSNLYPLPAQAEH